MKEKWYRLFLLFILLTSLPGLASASRKANLEGKATVIIEPVSRTEFNVYSITNKGDYLRHVFRKLEKPVQHDYGWYSPSIYHGDKRIIQGEFNFIHMIHRPNESGAHVGLGHGCETFLSVQFWADDREFNPETLNEALECTTFRMKSESIIYAADQATTKEKYTGDNVVPQQPLVESTRHFMDATIRGNNQLKLQNKLVVLRDDTRFERCYLGMMAAMKPYFDRVKINNVESTVNENYDNNSVLDGIRAVPPSTAVLIGSVVNTADKRRAELANSAEQWSTEHPYRFRVTATNSDSRQQQKMNILSYTTTKVWNKLYFQPVVTTGIAKHRNIPVDIFNVGDVIEGTIETEISV